MSAELYKGGDFNEAIAQCPYLNQLGETALQTVKDTYAALEGIDFDSIDFDAELAKITDPEPVKVASPKAERSTNDNDITVVAEPSHVTPEPVTLTASPLAEKIDKIVIATTIRTDMFAYVNEGMHSEERGKSAFSEAEVVTSIATQHEIGVNQRLAEVHEDTSGILPPLRQATVTSPAETVVPSPAHLDAYEPEEDLRISIGSNKMTPVAELNSLSVVSRRPEVTIEDVIGVAMQNVDKEPEPSSTYQTAHLAEVHVTDTLDAMLDEALIVEDSENGAPTEMSTADTMPLAAQLESTIIAVLPAESALEAQDQVRDVYELATKVFSETADVEDVLANVVSGAEDISLRDTLNEFDDSADIPALDEVTDLQELTTAVTKLLRALEGTKPRPQQVEHFIALLAQDIHAQSLSPEPGWIDRGGKEEKHSVGVAYSDFDERQGRFARLASFIGRHSYALAA